MPTVTLNDFKAILGKVNDGNVVFTRDGQGIEKANHGGLLSRAIHSYRVAPDDVAENRKIRNLLMTAISNSEEGKALNHEQIVRIRQGLGIEDNPDETSSRALGRRELKIALDTLEAMQRTNGIPNMHKDGTMWVDKPTSGNSPKFGNRMIARQYELMIAKGFPEAKVREVFNKVIGVFTQPKSHYRTAEKMVELLPKEFHGHKQAELAKFVRSNRALIESALVDRLVWKLVDGASNQPGQEFQMEVDPRKNFLEVIFDLMKSYGQNRDPVPHAVRLLVKPDAVAAPDDEGAKLTFDAIKATLGKKLDAIFSKSDRVSFASRQMDRFRQHVEADALIIYKVAYEKTAGTAPERKAAADAALAQRFPLLMRYSTEELEGLAKNTVFKEAFSKAFRNAIGDLPTVDGKVKAADLEPVFNAAFAAVDKKMDLTPLADAYVAKMGLEGEQATQARNVLVKALNEGGAKEAEMVGALRFQLMKAASGEPLAVKNMASGLAATSKDFAVFADAKIKDFVDPEVVTRQRNALFLSCGHAEVDDNHRTWIQRYTIPYAELVDEIQHKKDLTEDQKKAEIAKLEPYKTLMQDEVFLGKLCALIGAQKIPQTSPVQMKLMPGGGKFTTNVDELQECRQIVEQMADAIPLTNLKGLAQYMKLGLSEYDTIYGMSLPGYHSEFFLNLVMDGSIDFEAISPKARTFLLQNVVGYLNRGKRVAPLSLDKTNMPDAVLRTLYREVRASVLKLTEKFSAHDRRLVLAGRGVEQEEMPDNFQVYNFYNHEANGLPNGFSGGKLFQMEGLGSSDLHAILKALEGLGLNPGELDQPENWMKMLRLQVIVRANGGHLDGAVEWAERLTGKDFNEMTFADCEGILSKALRNETPVDPLVKLDGGRKSVATFLAGTVKTDEANLVSAEMPAFLAALRSLDSGTTDHATTTLFGEQVTLRRRPNGELTAKFATGDRLSLTVTRSAGELIAQIENEMTTHVSRYGAGSVKAILPPVPGTGEPIARPRELYAKVLSSALGLPPVDFAHLSTKDLQQAALDALANPDAVKARFGTPPTTYNNAEAVEMQARYLMADNVERSLVTMPPAPKARTNDERVQNLPDAATVRDFVADLFMNKDTWAYDAGSRKPGQRLETLLQSYAPEFKHLRAHPELLDALVPVMRDRAKTLLDTLATVDLKDPDVRTRLADIEKEIDRTVDDAMKDLQTKASALFTGREQVQRPLWQQTLAEISGSSGGIDVNTAEGRFLKKVLDNYFTKCDLVEKRAMLSAYLRNTDAQSTDGRQVAEVLKGAGPLLQKMLQKLSPDMFDEETRIAIKDMKSKLAPIPDTVIQAQLLELVRSSHGQILSVEVKKSIGQASVGQALLCHIRTKDHPVTGEDVVIKLLRPNVQTAVQREHKLMLDLARELDREDNSGTSQQTTFEGRYASILEEFDFTLEAENIDLGMRAYEKPTVTMTVDGSRTTETYDSIHSMNRHSAVDPRSGMLVLEKVDGEPVDRLLENDRAKVDEILSGMKVTTALLNRPAVTTYEAKSPEQLFKVRFDLRQRRDKLVGQRTSVVRLLDAWFERALFGDGVFHNDLHPGNVMMKDTALTVIDFGNVMRLKKQEQSELVFVFLAAMRGKTDDFLASIGNLLDDNGKSALNALSADLKKDLAVVFAKGTSKNVLPRALAAMSILQKRGVPVPETVHNFAQSLERIHGVVSAFDSEIREVERLSGETKFSADFAEDYMPAKRAEKMGVEVDAVAKMDEIFVLQGDPVDGLNRPELRSKAEALYQAFNSEIPSGNHPFDVAVRRNPETKEVVRIDPMDVVEKPGAEDVGTGVAPFCAEIRAKVFTAQDGGIAFLTEFQRKYAGIVNTHVKSGSDGGKIPGFAGLYGSTELLTQIEAYKQVLAAEPRDVAAVAAQQKEVLRAMLSLVLSFAEAEKGDLHHDCSCTPAVELEDFEMCVGTTLGKRSDSLANAMGEHMGIDKAKFNTVMEMARNGANPLSLVWAAGTDLGKFNTLRNLADELGNLDESATAYEKSLAKATKAANAWNGKLEKAQQLSPALRKKLAACARDVRVLPDWKPSLADAQGKADFLSVLGVALETVRATIAPDELSANALTYFARIYAAAAPTGLVTTLRAPENAPAVDAWVVELQTAAAQNAPGSDAQLAPFVAALRVAV